MKKQVGSLVAGSVLLFAASMTQAAVDEITVTAERKDASLQEVPIAVSAFQMEDVQNLQMDFAIDIGAVVPNMQTYNVTSNGSAMQVFMRGAGIQNPGFNASESPVGIYVDNIYRGRLATANLELADIERIEVLRGPQGTLYGRNTIAGAIKIITRTPEDEFWADGSVGYGNFATTKINASIGGPLAEGWGASISGLYNNREEGWIERGSTGGRKLGEYKNKAARAKLNYFGGDIFSATLTLGAVNGTNDGYNGIPYGPSYNPASAPGAPLEGFYDSLSPDSTIGVGETKQIDYALDLVWDFDSFSIKSISGVSKVDDVFKFDLNGGANQFVPGDPTSIVTGIPGIFVESESSNKTYSQEFVFQGQALDDRIDWLAGVFYVSEQGDQIYNPGIPATGDAIAETIDTDTTSYAVYAEGTWEFIDAWSVTLGGRYTKDDKKYTNSCASLGNPVGFPACFTALGAGADWTVDLDETFEEFTPRVVLQFQLNEGTSFYGSFSQGFQAGGFQTLCFGSQACSLQVYDPQKVNNYEVGVKSELFDRTLRTNFAAFHADYSDIQQTAILVPGLPIFPVLNVGSAKVNGLELEVNWAPTAGLNLFLIGAYADDSISSEAQAQLPNPNAERLPGLPEVTMRVGGDYRFGIFSNWDLALGADVNYVGDYYATINNNLLVPDYTRLNGFIGIDQPDGNWSLRLTGKNLTDSEDYVSGIAGGGTNIRTVLPPREYMLTVNYRYGNN